MKILILPYDTRGRQPRASIHLKIKQTIIISMVSMVDTALRQENLGLIHDYNLQGWVVVHLDRPGKPVYECD